MTGRPISRTIRRNVGVMAMGFNVVSGMKQILGVSSALEVLSARHGTRAPRLLLHGHYHRRYSASFLETDIEGLASDIEAPDGAFVVLDLAALQVA